MGLIPGLGSFPEGGIFLENPMDRGTLWATVQGGIRIRTEQLNNKTVALSFPGVMKQYRIEIYERAFGESK